jgi:hypothetical protein
MDNIRKQIVFIAIVLMLVSCSACGADRGTPFSIENQTNHTITIFINDDPLSTKIIPFKTEEFLSGAIPPSDAPWAPKKYHFEAKNDRGQIIYSQEFTRDELENIKYKIVIIEQ